MKTGAMCMMLLIMLFGLTDPANAQESASGGFETNGICYDCGGDDPPPEEPPPSPPPQPTYAATYIGHSVPSTIEAGQFASVSVQMRNDGTTTWTAAESYNLGSTNPLDNTRWGVGRVATPGSVAPGQTATFVFNITAPSAAGSYSFQWRMVRDGVTWFGAFTPDVAVQVQAPPPAPYDHAQYVQTLWPQGMLRGQPATVSVIFYNRGNTTWTAAGGYKLGSINPDNNTTWGIARVALPGPVAPGEAAIFTFVIVHPAAGTHSFGWRMVREGVHWFGDPLNGTMVVGNPPPAPTMANPVFSKTEGVEYHDDTANWVIGQVKRTTTNGIETSRTEFNTKAQPWKTYSFGKPQNILNYWQDGSLNTVEDGNGNTTSLSEYHRGIPRLIGFPATPDQPNGASTSAVVDDFGLIRSVTDENRYTTSYTYDPMGRLTRIEYPAGDTVAWLPKTIEFRALTAADWKPPGFVTGQWRQYVAQGNYVKLTYFDAMWRPTLSHEYDASNAAATLRSISTSYDSKGRIAFQSYPSSELIPALQGITTRYDTLGRVTKIEQSSELGVLTTTKTYDQIRIYTTNPRQQQTIVGHIMYDQPTYDLPRGIIAPEGAHTEIYRNALDMPTQLRRRNADGSLSASRYYAYDEHQRLCRVTEPETGATVMGYDSAGNLAWSASGLPAGTPCDANDPGVITRRANRTYDARNRMKTLAFPDGRGSQAWDYWPDGQAKAVVTYNDAAGTAPIENSYQYNSRRLLISETTGQPSWYTWTIGYGYDGNGALASQVSPTGLTLTYAPNALGQATAVRDTWNLNYATNVSYYPNGAIKQFTYGNGITHTMNQNARQLPERVTDNWGAVDYKYDYDANGNPTLITDYARGGDYSRWLYYDGLDRLTDAGSCSFGGDCWHRFTYDAIDNIKSWKLAGVKDYANYYYDPNSNRLISIQNTAGASTVGFDYDLQGNLSNKNGQGYDFDYGNRLRTVHNKEFYRYDAHGRRAMTWRQPGHIMLSMYGNSGQLVYQSDGSKAKSLGLS